MATKGSHHRFTDEDLALMDAVAATLTEPGVKPPSRTEVLRLALRELAARRLKTARKKSGKMVRDL